MRTILVALLLVMISGCVEDAEVPDPTMTDSDGDGYSDAVESQYGTNPDNATSIPVANRTTEPLTFTGSGTIIGGVEDVSGGGCGAAVDSGTVTLTWTIEAPTNASAVRVTDMSFTATYPQTMPEGDIYVFSPSGEQLTDSTGASIPPGSTDTVTVDGVQSPGEYRIEIRGCAGAGEVSLSASASMSYLRAEDKIPKLEE